MMAASYCDCLICRLEVSFIAELSDDKSHEEFRLFVVSSPILSTFPTRSGSCGNSATTTNMSRTLLPMKSFSIF